MLAHASVVQRRLMHAGRAWRTGYVEAVAVAPGHRRHGLGTACMASLHHVIRGAYELGALAATDEAMAFYAGLGWQRWRGRTSALTPSGVVHTPEAEECLFVMAAGEPHAGPALDGGARLDVHGEIICDWRDGDVW